MALARLPKPAACKARGTLQALGTLQARGTLRARRTLLAISHLALQRVHFMSVGLARFHIFFLQLNVVLHRRLDLRLDLVLDDILHVLHLPRADLGRLRIDRHLCRRYEEKDPSCSEHLRTMDCQFSPNTSTGRWQVRDIRATTY